MRGFVTARGCLSIGAILISMVLLSPALLILADEIGKAPIEGLFQDLKSGANMLVAELVENISANLPDEFPFPGGGFPPEVILFVAGAVAIGLGFWQPGVPSAAK